MAKGDGKELRFKFYHELEQLYHRFFDVVADADIGDGEAGRVAQALLRSRQEGLKYLISEEEMDKYREIYPEDY